MNETLTTIRGTIVATPVPRRVGDDAVVRLRIASNSRYQDRDTGEWRNGTTLYFTAACWGHLAERVGGKLFKGDGVIVQGRLHTNEYEVEGGRRSDLEMRVTAIGPDMARMDVTVKRPRPAEDEPTAVPRGDEPGDAAGEDVDDERVPALAGAGAPADPPF